MLSVSIFTGVLSLLRRKLPRRKPLSRKKVVLSAKDSALINLILELATRWELNLSHDVSPNVHYASLFGQDDFESLQLYFADLVKNTRQLTDEERRRMLVLAWIDREVEKHLKALKLHSFTVAQWLESTKDAKSGASLMTLLATSDPEGFERGFSAVRDYFIGSQKAEHEYSAIQRKFA